MYSRSSFQDPNEPYRIPDNYHGNAFHSPNDQSNAPAFPQKTDAACPMVAGEEQAVSHSPEKECDQSTAAQKKMPPSLLSALLPPKPKGLLGGAGGILGDIGTEELLILGIILLLSQNNSDDDILLLLLLLLLYK